MLLKNFKDNVIIKCDPKPEDTFSVIQTFVEKHYQHKCEVQFVYNGKKLDPNDTPASIGYKEESHIFIVVKLLESISSSSASYNYERDYQGDEVWAACQNNGNVMFNVIADLAARNPYFLSYLAVDREKAKNYVEETLRSEDFVLKVRGPSILSDPIAASNMHVSSETGFDIDRKNVEFIMTLCSLEPELYDQAHKLYLFFYRDITKTLTELKNLYPE